jgi:hypothetical protein
LRLSRSMRRRARKQGFSHELARSFDLQALQYEVKFFPVGLCMMMSAVFPKPPPRRVQAFFVGCVFPFSRPKSKARPAHKH